MDALDIGYRYAPEGHAHLAVTYRPRFFLPRYSLWLDAKRELPEPAETRAAERLFAESGDDVAILIGQCLWPWTLRSYDGWLWWRNAAGQAGSYSNVLWVKCLECEWLGLARPRDPCPECWERSALCIDTPELIRAYEDAWKDTADAWLQRMGLA